MAKRRWHRIPPALRREIIRAAARGATYREICDEFDVAQGVVVRVVAPLGGVIGREDYQPVAGRLSAEDRVEIKLGLELGQTYAEIGERVHRHAANVGREVNRNGGPKRYRPIEAHRAALSRARRPKTTKLEANPALCARVVADLERLLSPEQIAQRLRTEFGDDPSMQISHETIYKSLYVQGRGELRRELAACLRTGRAARRPRGRIEHRGKIADMVMISERPSEAEDRAVPGHWEGDLIMGKNNRSAIGTLVERFTRFVILLHLPNGWNAEAVREAMVAAIATLPDALWRSIAWDQGTEMARHVEFSVETGVPVYFCDPHSPWQRGSNENTNGLLRQYFPKGSDLAVHSAEHLARVSDSLNSRPRKTLGWKTPAEALAEVIALTA